MKGKLALPDSGRRRLRLAARLIRLSIPCAA
jgi:hypothetical protein